IADQTTITGVGTVADPFKVEDLSILTVKLADDAVTTQKIADDNVTPDKIEQGDSGEVLTTDGAGDVVWAVPVEITGPTGSIFFASDDGTGTGPLIENNTNFFWDQSNNRLGIGTNTPTSNLHTSGSFSTNIRTVDTAIAEILDNDHTIILEAGVTQVNLPDANTCTGRIYVLKNITGG